MAISRKKKFVAAGGGMRKYNPIHPFMHACNHFHIHGCQKGHRGQEFATSLIAAASDILTFYSSSKMNRHLSVLLKYVHARLRICSPTRECGETIKFTSACTSSMIHNAFMARMSCEDSLQRDYRGRPHLALGEGNVNSCGILVFIYPLPIKEVFQANLRIMILKLCFQWTLE